MYLKHAKIAFESAVFKAILAHLENSMVFGIASDTPHFTPYAIGEQLGGGGGIAAQCASFGRCSPGLWHTMLLELVSKY